jgi:hypothetical protein
MAGDDKAITAIVAGAAQDCDGAHRPACTDGDRDGAAGSLHHIRAADAGGLGRAIGFAHLGRRQKRKFPVLQLSLGKHFHPPANVMMAANALRRTGSESTQ